MISRDRVAPALAILARLREGTLARVEWTGTLADGRSTACLLAAIWPPCGRIRNASACPAWLLPPWLARLTPWIDDEPSAAAWPSIVRRYAVLLRRSGVLTRAAWRRLDYRCRRAAVLEARSHVAAENPALASIDRVISLLDREIAGDAPSDAEWDAAIAAAADCVGAVVKKNYAAEAAVVVFAGEAVYPAATLAGPDSCASADRIVRAVLDAWALEIEEVTP